ncbi:MAG: ABC transporter permease subunit [Clostridia bacterium]|jgi:ABC-type glycerol-3-phosphate transport system permease component|nr:ABC transporter permease subunit [Clostridia bacterium]
MKERKLSGKIIIFLVSIGAALIMLVPFIWMFVTSFKTPPDITAHRLSLIPRPFTWENYTRVFDEIPLGTYYLNSALVTGVIIMTALVFSSMAGFAFAKYSFPGREFFFILILSTFIVPFQVTIIPLYLEMKWFGLIDTRLSLVIPHIASAFGTFLIRQYLQSVPDELLDSARIDGCSEFRIYWNIVMPLCKPVLAVLAVFNFFWGWNDFLWPLIVINSAEKRTVVLSITTSNYLPQTAGAAGGGTEWGPLMVLSFFVMLPTIIFFVFLQRHIVKGITLTGIK